MQFLKKDLAALDATVETVRDHVHAVRRIAEREAALGDLRDWSGAVELKLQQVAAVPSRDPRELPPWYSPEFTRRVRADRSVKKRVVLDILKRFRDVEREFNALLASVTPAAAKRLTRPIYHVVCDFVVVESAFYGRFPELEPSETRAAPSR